MVSDRVHKILGNNNGEKEVKIIFFLWTRFDNKLLIKCVGYCPKH